MRSRIAVRLRAFRQILHGWVTPGLILLVLGEVAAAEALPRLQEVSSPLLIVAPEDLNPLLATWIEDFRARHTGVEVHHQAGNSLAASSALAAGLAHLVIMPRAMTRVELDTFSVRHGRPPVSLRIGLDAVRILVHRDNPIAGLTLQELAAIFSAAPHCGAATHIVEWGQLTAMKLWRGRPIQLFGNSAGSDIVAHFRGKALCGGEFKADMSTPSDSQALLQAISDSQNALGFAGLTGSNPQVRALPLSQRAGRPFIEPVPSNVLNGTYPLSHYLYVYFDHVPKGALHPPLKGFLSLILSPEGQASLAQSGLIPLPSAIAAQEKAKLD